MNAIDVLFLLLFQKSRNQDINVNDMKNYTNQKDNKSKIPKDLHKLIINQNSLI